MIEGSLKSGTAEFERVLPMLRGQLLLLNNLTDKVPEQAQRQRIPNI